MEKPKGVVNYVVKYNSDPRLVTNNHKSNIVYLTDVDERGFNNIDKALEFLSECISPITSVEELIPECRTCKGEKKFLLPEQNIRPKHVLVHSMENEFFNEEFEWD